jgi:hypothetical protein
MSGHTLRIGGHSLVLDVTDDDSVRAAIDVVKAQA